MFMSGRVWRWDLGYPRVGKPGDFWGPSQIRRSDSDAVLFVPAGSLHIITTAQTGLRTCFSASAPSQDSSLRS